MRRGSDIQDLHNNSLQISTLSVPLFRYNYISPDDKAIMGTAGEASLYSMIISIGGSLTLSLIL